MFDPIGETNALHANNSVPLSPAEPIKMAKRNRVTQTILNGPDYVIVRRNKRDYAKISIFDLNLKIVKRSILVQQSWSIYSDGDQVPGFILRHTKIEGKDIQEAKAKNTLPITSVFTRYLTQAYYQPLETECQLLDSVLIAGNLPLFSRETYNPWNIYSLYRTCNAFSIELNWNTLSESPQLEIQMSKLAALIEETLREHKQHRPRKIQEMEFVYDNPSPDAIELLSKNVHEQLSPQRRQHKGEDV